MTWLEWCAVYMAAGVTVVALMAIRDQGYRQAAYLIALWPPIMLLVAFWLLVDWAEQRTKYRCDFVWRRDLSAFGRRDCTWTEGRAYRAFWIEFQWWRVKGKP